LAGKRERLERDWSGLRVFAGLVGIILSGPGFLLALLPQFHDLLLGDNPLVRFGLLWTYLAIFGGAFALSVFSFLFGLRGVTQPPSLLYRLTHPRLPHWATRDRGAWPVS